MKFAWTGDGPWRALEEGVRIQARRKGRAWTGNGPWRAVECRCFVQANLINAATPAGIGGQRRGGEVGGSSGPVRGGAAEGARAGAGAAEADGTGRK